MHPIAIMAVLGWGGLLLAGCAEVVDTPRGSEVSMMNDLTTLRTQIGAMETQVGNKADKDVVERKANRNEVVTARDVSEVKGQVQSISQQTADLQSRLNALQQRMASLEETANRDLAVRDPMERPRRPEGTFAKTAPVGPTAKGAPGSLRSQVLVVQAKMEVASASGVSASVIEYAEVVGFSAGRADLDALLFQEPRTRAQLDSVKRQLSEGKIEVLTIMAFEDTSKCLSADEKCTTVALRRGWAVAEYLGAPKATVDAREPTDQWGSPRDNRRVLVFYAKRGTPADKAAATPAGR